MSRAAALFPAATQPKPLLSETAYSMVREKILVGDLPSGSRVSEKLLAENLGQGRAPIRDALQKLQHEGLIRQVPRYGTIVHRPTQEELDTFYEVVEALFGWAAAKAASVARPQDIGRLEMLSASWKKMAGPLRGTCGKPLDDSDVLQAMQLIADFSMLLLTLADNIPLIKTIHMYRARIIAALSVLPPRDLSVFAGHYAFQQRLIRALRKRDSNAARCCMENNVRYRKQLMHATLDRRVPRSRSGEDRSILRAVIHYEKQLVDDYLKGHEDPR